MTDEDLASYQKVRAEVGLPEIPDSEALVEAQALIHFMTLASGGKV